MKLLVTRPASDAGALADLLIADGHTVLIDPMIAIRPREQAGLDLTGIAGLLFTSGNGVRTFAELSTRRDIPVYAVGDRTASLARELGFAAVESADGDVAALAALVRQRRNPDEGALLHPAGSEAVGDLAGRLGEAGYAVRRIAIYDAEPASELTPATRAALGSGTLDGVLLFSPRTARHFAALVQLSGHAEDARRLQVWCLSPAVAEALGGLAPAATHVAAQPTQAALLSLIPPGSPGRPKEDVVIDPLDPKRPDAEPKTSVGEAPPATAKPRRIVPLAIAGVVLIALIGVAALFRTEIKDALSGRGTSLQQQAGAPASDTGPTADRSQETAAPPPSEQQTASQPPSEATSPAPGAVPMANPPYSASQTGGDQVASGQGLAALQQSVSALDQRVAGIEAKPAVDPAAVQTMAADLQRVSATLNDATTRLARLESQMQQQAAAQRNEKAMVLAVAELKDRMAGSGPFDGPVAVLKSTAGDDPALAPSLAVLDRFAAQGVESRVRLAEELEALPGAVNRPAPLAADAGLWQRMEARAEGLISIRRVDDGTGADKLPPGPDRDLAVAAAALKAGDLAGAVQAVRGIDGTAATIVKPWLDAAGDRLAVEDAVARLSSAATQRLQAAQGGTSQQDAGPQQ